MTILAPMKSAALVLMGRKPTTFFGATQRFEMEIADLANEVAEDIAQYQDWQALQATATLTGDGVTSAFALPEDYSRMMMDAQVQSSAYRLWGFQRYDDLGTFTRDHAAGFRSAPGGWIITGGQIKFNPAPTGTATFPYISSAWAEDGDGRKSEFTSDQDEFLLPERLLKLGLIWRWRESKQLNATGDQEAFVKALDEYATKDGGSSTYRYNGRGSIPGTHTAWPWPLG